MFICRGCHKEYESDFDTHMFKSRGMCEVCGKVKVCADCMHSKKPNTKTYNPDIQIVFFPEGSISPGGKAAFGINLNGRMVQDCIGSGENFRDAKACALRNIRNVLRQVKGLQENAV